jgi:exopolysaccharide biosynthesis polyprenyl glycosylphosphotransferase
VPRRVLVIGTDWAAETIIEMLKREARNSYEVVGVIGETETLGQLIKDVPIIGSGGDLLNHITRYGITELVLSSTRELPGDIFQAVMDAYERGVAITPMPLLYERVTERVPVEHVGNNWAVVLPVGGISVLNPYPLLKRLVDIALASVGVLLLALLLPFIAIAIYVDSPGSIFYTQERVGLNGRLFRIIKFRTMIPNAEKMTGAVFATKNDTRVTRMGRFMRKTRLDEVPQLINILRGDMSLIGPRPERPEHVRRLQEKIPFYRTRHTIRPGVTGWAQVRYKYGETDDDARIKLQYDLYYIRHRSLLLDFNILIRTIGKVLKMGGQ